MADLKLVSGSVSNAGELPSAATPRRPHFRKTAPVPPTHCYFALHARQVAKNGYFCFPLPPRSKRTYWKNWSRFCAEPPTEKQNSDWLVECGDHGIAIAAGHNIVAVDIDCPGDAQAETIERMTRVMLGDTPLKRVGQFPKRALVYRVSVGAVIASESVGKVDLIGDGRYLVGFGIHPETLQPYCWERGTPADVPVSALPAVSPAQIVRFLAAVKAELLPDDRPTLTATSESAAAPGKEDTVPPASGPNLVLDGRDTFLSHLVYLAYSKHSTVEAIAGAAWSAFSSRADLSRPKRNGREPWSYDDALTKARYLIASGKARPRDYSVATAAAQSSSNPEMLQQFSCAVDRACAAGQLTRIDAAVSHAMLRFAQLSAGVCFASCETLAAQVGCRPATVKKARRQLRLHRLWDAAYRKGGRGLLADYRPVLAAGDKAPASLADGKPTS